MIKTNNVLFDKESTWNEYWEDKKNIVMKEIYFLHNIQETLENEIQSFNEIYKDVDSDFDNVPFMYYDEIKNYKSIYSSTLNNMNNLVENIQSKIKHRMNDLEQFEE